MQHFETLWKEQFSDIPLLPWTFKEKFQNRWLRIHSLPNSDRYAKNREEMQIILSRQRHIFETIL